MYNDGPTTEPKEMRRWLERLLLLITGVASGLIIFGAALLATNKKETSMPLYLPDFLTNPYEITYTDHGNPAVNGRTPPGLTVNYSTLENTYNFMFGDQSKKPNKTVIEIVNNLDGVLEVNALRGGLQVVHTEDVDVALLQDRIETAIGYYG